ncbi:c-Myc-binding protein homolog [Anopheles bellator]|uniref:c-Myc-binding protein homolog n=1 Tax=Anopheles bellator TaxID=139047 RepID=UPI0026491892|nr:c-Myc-binding protein homolog [Anopheles bellator]
MSTYKPIDVSKEDFRKYLSQKGVLDAMTKVLTKCNSDRPENALEYLADNLGERVQQQETIARLTAALSDARKEIELLKDEMRALKGGSGQDAETTAPAEVTENVNKLSEEAPSPAVPTGDQKSTVPSVAGTTEGASKEETVPSPKASDTVGGSKQQKDAAPENDQQDPPVITSSDKVDEKE